MLVLTRKENETIHIGDDVTITVVRFSRNNKEPSVRIGIDAPRGVNVWRGELENKPPTQITQRDND